MRQTVDRRVLTLVAVLGLGSGLACEMSPELVSQLPQSVTIDGIAEDYVKLVLAMGHHDADYVDAYYGPSEWQSEVEAHPRSLAEIGSAGDQLLSALSDLTLSDGDDDELVRLRHEYLRRQLEALQVRVGMVSGETLTFDEESRALYDAVSPTQPLSYFERTRAELEQLLPGPGTLIERYEAFRRDFVIPADRLASVFDLAIAECRARTIRHVELPPGESFSVEYVTDKSWSGYNWYQGGFRSLIQVNTDFPIFIDRAIDLACHEGYPGHHVYNVLLEKHLVRDRGWPEFSVYALFSPQSLIAEGTANYGIAVAFPTSPNGPDGPDGPRDPRDPPDTDERLEFEREVLFPAAGLDPSRAAEYARVQAVVDRLAYAGNEAARGYLDGTLDRREASTWLTQYAMMLPDRAMQRTRFFDQYRSYVINYNLGRDLVAGFVEERSDGPRERWQEFVRLLASPRLPSGLGLAGSEPTDVTRTEIEPT